MMKLKFRTITWCATPILATDGRLTVCMALHRNPSQSYRASPAILDHTVLPTTWCRWTHRDNTSQAGRYSIHLSWRDGRLSSAYVWDADCLCAGLLVGIPVLKNFKVYPWERKALVFAVCVYVILVITSISVNIITPARYPVTDWRPCCPLPCVTYPNCTRS